MKNLFLSEPIFTKFIFKTEIKMREKNDLKNEKSNKFSPFSPKIGDEKIYNIVNSFKEEYKKIIDQEENSSSKKISELEQKSFELMGDKIADLYKLKEPKKDWKIVIQNAKKGKQILLEKRNGKILNINSFLPERCSIKESDIFCFIPHTKQILYDKKNIHSITFIPNLLHEIGHAHDQKRSEKAFNSISYRLFNDVAKSDNNDVIEKEEFQVLWNMKTGELLKEEGSIAVKKFFPEESDDLIPFVALFLENMKRLREGDAYFLDDKKRSKSFPKWFMNWYYQEILQKERNATAYSLKLIRKLQREKFPLFRSYSEEALKELLYLNLYTYEDSARKKNFKETKDWSYIMDKKRPADLFKENKLPDSSSFPLSDEKKTR